MDNNTDCFTWRCTCDLTLHGRSAYYITFFLKFIISFDLNVYVNIICKTQVSLNNAPPHGMLTMCLCFTVYPPWSGCSQCPGEWWLCSEDCWFWSSKGYPLSWLLPQNHWWPTACEMDGPWGSISPCVHNTVRRVST